VDRASANQSAARQPIAPRAAGAWRVPALLVCSAVVAGCGKSEGAGAGVELAARVNSEAISAQELGAALKQAPTAALDASAKRAMLDKLIEQRLAMQGAIAKRLDRTPQVAQAIEAARTEILARAYMEHIARAHTAPTAEEVRTYYAEHPELFGQRRIYSVEEIALTGQPALATALKERLAMGQSVDELVGWLESRAVRYTVNRGSRAAEEVPLDMLPALHAMKDGEVRVIDAAANGLVVVRLLGSRLAPIDEASAAPLIREYLRRRRSHEAVAVELKRLRQQAKIEYAGPPGRQR
jgi:EpsD family peptidyl-prolyl cis-trans isomerase